MAYLGLASQQRLIKEEEKKEILLHYRHFLEEMNGKKIQVLSLAAIISHNPGVQKLLAESNRQALQDLLMNTYVRLKNDFGIAQFHFHTLPATSFLRLHYPEKYGEEMISFRKTIVDSIKTGSATAGLELGVMGFGIRGVAPVFYGGKVVGTVEIGHSFGKAFLNSLHEIWGIDIALYKIEGKYACRPIARARKGVKEFYADSYPPGERIEEPSILIAPEDYPDRSILLGPVKDYSGKVVALVEINMDRSEIRHKLSQTRDLMVFAGLIGIAISFFLIFLVASQFIKPIKEIVQEAQDIAHEKRESRLESRPNDEIGTLTQALNTMLVALKKRRMEVEDHARNLERRVRERTADLVASMENYRTLVDNVPLIVYRLLEDGTTEFINSYLIESLGYSIEEAVGDKGFWREKILDGDPEAYKDLFATCFQDAEECRIERFVRQKSGRLLTLIDHAIPARDENGSVKWIDGIMMDITELKRLQERALRTEEIRILGEISARMAHEIRNPLVTAGGFARRLCDSLPENDPHHKLARIIVKEVARIESFLRILLSSIRPFELSMTDVDVNQLLRSWLTRLKDRLKSKNIKVVEELSLDAPEIQADDDKLNKAFENLLKHAIITMPAGESLFISTNHMGEQFIVTFRHKVIHLSDEDMEQFFFPHIEDKTEWTIPDLPLSKIIIHRHGGKIDLFREREDILVMKIELPIRLTVECGI